LIERALGFPRQTTNTFMIAFQQCSWNGEMITVGVINGNKHNRIEIKKKEKFLILLN
jgi:hypothetical protein